MILSIITITKNNVLELKHTIKSIQSQKNFNFEIDHIVIDGNSSDGTLEFLKSKNIRFISESDKGIYDAFNKGLKIAKGDFISFLNSGDVYYESTTLFKVFENLNFESNVIWFKNEHKRKNKVLRQTIVPEWACKILKIMPPHQATFLNARLFKNIFYDIDFKIAGDYDFFLKNFNLFKNGKFINLIVVTQNYGGVSNNGINSKLKGNIEAYQSLKKYSKFPKLFLIIKLTYKIYLKCIQIFFY